MDYTMALIVDGREIGIPVLPQKLEVSSPGKNDKATVLELGEILILRKKGLRSVAWGSFFPAYAAPYVTGAISDPIEAIKAIQAARDAEKPIRFLLTGADLDINMEAGVEALDYEERPGETGDLYYDIKLTEWKDYAPKRIILPTATETRNLAQAQEPARSGQPEQAAAKTYTVVKGDSLWAIAKRHYGSGARWNDIYQANKGVIGSNPNLIYPGQVFTLP